MSERRLWSVTTIIDAGLGMNPGLGSWIGRTVATYAVDHRAAVDALLDSGDRDGAVDLLVRSRFRKTKHAALRGTKIHRAAEAFALGVELPDGLEGTEPWIEHYRRFLDDFRPHFLASEAPVYNLAYSYAGTLDAIVRLSDGLDYCLDIKTTDKAPGPDVSRPPYPEVALQLAAYSRAELVGLDAGERREAGGRRYYLVDPDTDRTEPMPEVAGALCLVVSPHDYALHPIRTGDDVWESFLYVREAARWRLEVASTVVGPPVQPDPQEVAE